MIEVEGLSKHYGSHVAVDGVSFVAEKGQILGFLGPNGAGKTTTMRMLTCYLPPTAGTARIAGHDILTDSMAVRRRVGYLPENVPLYPDLTVAGYLEFVGTLKGMAREAARRRIEAVMRDCGIVDVRARTIGKLSRGYRQRVGLAQALLNDPEVLILDEPTVGLDPRQIIEIRELIRSLAGERTVILSTHILPEVSLLCQRVIIINQGRLISDDTPDNLGRSIGQATELELEVRGPAESVAGALARVPGVAHARRIASDGATSRVRVDLDDPGARENVAAAVVNAGFGLLSMRSRDVSLEDVFVRLVTEEENAPHG